MYQLRVTGLGVGGGTLAATGFDGFATLCVLAIGTLLGGVLLLRFAVAGSARAKAAQR